MSNYIELIWSNFDFRTKMSWWSHIVDIIKTPIKFDWNLIRLFLLWLIDCPSYMSMLPSFKMKLVWKIISKWNLRNQRGLCVCIGSWVWLLQAIMLVQGRPRPRWFVRLILMLIWRIHTWSQDQNYMGICHYLQPSFCLLILGCLKTTVSDSW